MSRAGRSDDAREWIARIFTRAEDVVYVGVGVLLAASALALLVTSAVAFVKSLLSGALAVGLSEESGLGGQVPVEPKPPVPRVVGGSSATGVSATRSIRWTTSWAMRSPRLSFTGVSPRLTSSTCTSPR